MGQVSSSIYDTLITGWHEAPPICPNGHQVEAAAIDTAEFASALGSSRIFTCPVDERRFIADARRDGSEWEMDVRLPIHYRDNGELCEFSGQLNAVGAPCARGCSGSREHYANDGHAECEDDACLSTSDSTTPSKR